MRRLPVTFSFRDEPILSQAFSLRIPSRGHQDEAGTIEPLSYSPSSDQLPIHTGDMTGGRGLEHANGDDRSDCIRER